MKKPNVIQEKTYAFALSIVKFAKKLAQEKEFVMSQQILKSGTSIGANVEEALQAQSKKDFISKLSIALKESHETDYWLRLLKDAQITAEASTDALRTDLHAIINILTAIIKTSRSTL